MASTIPLSTTIAVVQTFLRSAPLTGVGGVIGEPSLTNATYVAGVLLSPPFAWRWNRASGSFTTNPGTQDYTVNLPNFGWLEKASLIDTTVDNITSQELEVVLNLGIERAPNNPARISARLDDDLGNITFRLSPPPHEQMTINFDYQLAAPTFTSTSQTWSPIPDYLSWLFTEGFLAKAYEYWGDERYPTTMQLFIASLIGANGGLSDSQINIFMQDRINSNRESQTESVSQVTRRGKGLF